jgi:hypothetical protein
MRPVEYHGRVALFGGRANANDVESVVTQVERRLARESVHVRGVQNFNFDMYVRGHVYARVADERRRRRTWCGNGSGLSSPVKQ